MSTPRYTERPALQRALRPNTSSKQNDALALWLPGGTYAHPLNKNRPSVIGTTARPVPDPDFGRVWDFTGSSPSRIIFNPFKFEGITFDGKYTFSIWAKWDTTSGTTNAMSWSSGTFSVNMISMRSGVIVFGAPFGGNLGTMVASASANTWYHLTVVGLAASSQRLFVNGKFVTTGNSTSAAALIYAAVGCSFDSGEAEYMDGKVADARAYSRSLSDMEVWNLYDNATRWALYRPYRIRYGKAPSGTVTPITPAGTFTSAGSMKFQTQKQLAGVLTDGGALKKQPNKILVAAITPGGIVVKRVNKPISGAVTSSGALSRQRVAVLAISGVLTLGGVLKNQIQKRLTGVITPAGALNKLVYRVLTGALTSSGVLSKKVNKTFPGTLGTAGALRSQVNKLFTGAITLSGIVRTQLNKSFAGVLTLGGGLTKQVNKLLSGALTPTGATSVSKVGAGLFTLNVGGTLTLVGALIKKPLRTFAGALPLAGALRNQANKRLTGTLTSSGALTRLRIVPRTFTGAMASSGLLRRVTNKLLTGVLIPSGALRFSLSRLFTGTLALAGAAFKQANITLRRFLPYDSVVPYDTNIPYDGTTTPVFSSSGELQNTIVGTQYVSLSGAMASAGALRKQVNKLLSGVLSLAGFVTPVTTHISTFFTRIETSIQLDPRLSGIRHTTSKIGVAVASRVNKNRIVSGITKRIGIAPRVEP